MSSNRQQPVPATPGKSATPQPGLSCQALPDERYPGSFFRVPGVPTPGKTTWSLAK